MGNCLAAADPAYVLHSSAGRSGGEGQREEEEEDDDDEEEEAEARIATALEQVAAALSAPQLAADTEAAAVDLADFTNLVVTPQGVDGRLEPLLAAAAAAVRGQGETAAPAAGMPAAEARQLLVARLRERAAEFGDGVGGVGGAGLHEPAVAAFRASKRAVAEAALNSLTGAAA